MFKELFVSTVLLLVLVVAAASIGDPKLYKTPRELTESVNKLVTRR